MQSNSFPIQPLRDNVIVELCVKVSILLENSANVFNEGEIVYTKVVAIGTDVLNIKVGDNLIINNHGHKIAVKINDNEKDPKVVLDKAKGVKLIGQTSTTKEVVAYFIINQLDILAIDNQ